jgi:hypothetical protein
MAGGTVTGTFGRPDGAEGPAIPCTDGETLHNPAGTGGAAARDGFRVGVEEGRGAGGLGVAVVLVMRDPSMGLKTVACRAGFPGGGCCTAHTLTEGLVSGGGSHIGGGRLHTTTESLVGGGGSGIGGGSG